MSEDNKVAPEPKPFKDCPASVTSGYVGWLTEHEAAILQTMKVALQEQGLEWENDQELLRFLRARKFDLEKAVLMFTNFKKWYAENGIHRYPDEFPHKARALAELVPSAFAGFDKEGHPIQIERTGKMDVPTLLSAVSGAAILEGWIWGQQAQIRRCNESCERLGLPPGSIERFTQILDVDGLSMAHAQMQQFLSPITKCGEANFPERLSKTLIVNYGWVFSIIFGIVKLTLDPVTREKIILCPTHEDLHKYIDPSQLPKRYGGTQEDIATLNDPDVEALRAKFLNDDQYKAHYNTFSILKGESSHKEFDIDPTKQYSYCFRCNEEVKFKAIFVPNDTQSEEDHFQVSAETTIQADKWPTLGTFSSTNGKPGKLRFSWANDNWWGAKTIQFAFLDREPEPMPIGGDESNSNEETAPKQDAEAAKPE